MQAHAQREYATGQTNGVTGLCLLCGVSNPNNPVNSVNLEDYSQFNITTGLLGVSVHQTLIFPSVSSTGCDSLIVGIGSSNAILSANLFGGITVQTFNGTTANNDAQVVDSSIIRLLQNNTRAEILLHPGQSFDRVKLTLSSGLVGLLNGFHIYYAYRNSGRPANPIYTVPQGRTCGNVNLLVSNYEPGIYYTASVNYTGSGNLNFDTSYTVYNSNSIPVRDLAYYFNATAAVSIRAVNPFTGCQSDSVKQLFIFGGHAAPVKVTGDSVVICKGDTAIVNANLFNDPNGTNLALIRWYDSPTGGNLLYTGHNFSVSPDTTTTYYVTAAFECDYPVRTPARVIVRKLAAPDYVVPQGVACGIQHLPVLNHAVGYSYRVRFLYRSFQGTVADTSYVVSNSNSITTPPIYPKFPVDVDVFVQTMDSVTGCRSDTVHMIYSMGGATAMPAVDEDSLNICLGDSVTLHVFVPGLPDATIRFRWYDTPTGGNLLSSSNYYRVSPDSTTTYYAASGYECQYPERAKVVVTVSNCFNNLVAKETASRLNGPLQDKPKNHAYNYFPIPRAA
ncbi:hypothetical protein [Paraflavitalea speifideaquila]|uniref:immunoglobulin domain-containing protein n=1 Tax=Paraflavitalea speifideaquila TaxID=3076558 RepID=UPI0028E4480E|nr:hypothetical protein [Paraflavitalea speifideiaquila]